MVAIVAMIPSTLCDLQRKTAMKECPEWMQFSTITSAEHLPSVQQTSSSETWSAAQSTTGTVLIKLNSPPQTMMTTCFADVQRDEKIKAELLAYEKSKPSFNQPPQDESSNSDDDDDEDGMNQYHGFSVYLCMNMYIVRIRFCTNCHKPAS